MQPIKKEYSKIIFNVPINYTGSKNHLLGDIKKLIPSKIGNFVDVFGGGFNVGSNIEAKKIIYNDINFLVKDLIKSFNEIDTYRYLLYLRKIAKKFGLSLEKSSNFYTARDFYNSKEIKERDPRMLFLLAMYGFRQQIRFNSNLDFNIPVGERWFNERIFERFISFSRMIREKNIVYESKNFDELDQYIEEDAYFYFDPP